VKISNIRVTNLLSDELNIFVEFIAGGDKREESLPSASGKMEHVILGHKGPLIRSEVLRDIKKDETRTFLQVLDYDYKGSYKTINEQKLKIEVFHSENWRDWLGLGIQLLVHQHISWSIKCPIGSNREWQHEANSNCWKSWRSNQE
jgi:hypothetical protein